MKRFIFTFLFFLWLSSESYGALAVGNSEECHVDGAADQCTTSAVATTASGSLFVCNAAIFGSFVSVTDSKSNTYSTAVPEVVQSDEANSVLRQVYKENGVGGAGHTFTLTAGSASDFPALVCLEVTGAATSVALDQIASMADTANTSHTVGPTGTTVVADEIVIAAGATGSGGTNSYTITTGGYTTDESVATDADSMGIVVGHIIVSATGTQSMDFTTSGSVAAMGVMGTYKILQAVPTRIVQPIIIID